MAGSEAAAQGGWWRQSIFGGLPPTRRAVLAGGFRSVRGKERKGTCGAASPPVSPAAPAWACPCPSSTHHVCAVPRRRERASPAWRAATGGGKVKRQKETGQEDRHRRRVGVRALATRRCERRAGASARHWRRGQTQEDWAYACLHRRWIMHAWMHGILGQGRACCCSGWSLRESRWSGVGGAGAAGGRWVKNKRAWLGV